jgi:hypothetical protein
MSAKARATAVLLVLILPLTASAFGFRSRPETTTYYSYYPAPVVWVAAYPVYCVPVVVAVPAPPPRVYAAPTAAPPLANPPPAPPMPPAVGEQRTSYYDAYAVAGREGQPVDGERCSVGFWNSTDRDLVLRVAGQVRALPRGRGVTLVLPRDFVWQLDSRDPQVERVQAKESAVEIVIRR